MYIYISIQSQPPGVDLKKLVEGGNTTNACDRAQFPARALG